LPSIIPARRREIIKLHRRSGRIQRSSPPCRFAVPAAEATSLPSSNSLTTATRALSLRRG
jgi:hypothetical protein